MKIGKIIENVLIILFFLAVMVFPWAAYFLGVENNLQGADEKVELSFEKLDDYIIQNFPGREILVRTKNQLLYSFFDISPNSSITKVNDTLLSTETLNYYYHGLHDVDAKDIDVLINKLERLNTLCNEGDKKLVIITTPTKPRYYYDILPFADDVILAYQKKKVYTPYNILHDNLLKTDLHYFDCIDYIDNNKNKVIAGEVPLFYKSGHHWSNYKGNVVGLGFLDYLRDEVGLTMPELKIVASPSNVSVYPDSDLFDVLNIYDKPNEQFYSSNVEFVKFNNENYNYIIQGGSFLGGLLLPCITLGLDNDVIHIENKACICDNYATTINFETYDELNDKIDILDKLSDADVIILEINELNVYNATFGFLDYILSHEEYL